MNQADNLISAELAQILDLLDRIEKLNKLLQVHREHGSEAVMIKQYEERKAAFVDELNNLMAAYNLQITDRSSRAA